MKTRNLSRRLGFVGLVTLAPLAISVTANAAPFMNINFDGDTVGQMPATNASTAQPVTQPYSIGGYSDSTTDPYGDSPPTADDGTALVGNPDGMSKAVVLTSNPANDQQGAVYLDTEYSVASQEVKLSFDLDIINQPASATIQPKTLNGNPSDNVGILFGVNNFVAGNPGFLFAAAPTSATSGVFGIRNPNTNINSFFTYSLNTPYNILLDANYDTGTLNAYVNGTLEGSNIPFQSGPVLSANPDETFFYLNAEPGYSNEVAIDNIQASVPEPATFSLIGIGALALLRRKRRSI